MSRVPAQYSMPYATPLLLFYMNSLWISVILAYFPITISSRIHDNCLWISDPCGAEKTWINPHATCLYGDTAVFVLPLFQREN
jgi:hypothetical protein